MGLLAPDFSHDLFVSYAHGDFEGVGESALKKWSQVFVSELVDELKHGLGNENISCFLDESSQPGFGIDRTSDLTPQLRKAIAGSGVLVLLMSPFYLKSKWCAREVGWFVEEATRRRCGEGLLFVIRVSPTEAALWPPELKGEDNEALPGFWFFDRREAKEKPYGVRPYGWKDPRLHDRDGRFNSSIRDVVDQVAKCLTDLKKRLDERRREEDTKRRLTEATGQKLYLYGRNTQARAWEQAYDELDRAGFTVLPTEPDPDPEAADPGEALKAARSRVQLMADTDALVLLRPDAASRFDLDLTQVGMRDRRSARETGGGPLPCAVVDFAGGPASERQRRVAEKLNIDWLPAGPSWPVDLRQRLQSIGGAGTP